MRPPRTALAAVVVVSCLTAVIFTSRRPTPPAARSQPAVSGRIPSTTRDAHVPATTAPVPATLPPRTLPPGDPDSNPAPQPVTFPIEEASLHAFRSWCEAHLGFLNPSSSLPLDLLAEGRALARARRTALRDLIRRHPERALQLAIPWHLRQQLPPPIADELEETISTSGRLEVWCARQAHGSTTAAFTERRFSFGDRSFECFTYGRRLSQHSATDTVLHGIAVDGSFAAHEDPLRVPDPEEQAEVLRSGILDEPLVCALTGEILNREPLPALVQHGETWLALAEEGLVFRLNSRLAAIEPGFRRATEPPAFQQATHGVKRVLFIRARFPDDLREPITVAEATDVMRAANEFFVANSYNNLSLVSTVGPLVTLPQPKLYYAVVGPGALREDALAATREAGVDPDAFDLDLVRFESVPGFTWAGLGAVGGRGTWLQSSGLGVVCHELGHNLGLGHANFWRTTRPDFPDDTRNLPFDPDSEVGLDSIIGPGDDIEYGDPFDVMGSGGAGSGHFSGLHKLLLGWIPGAGLQTIREEGTYTVLAHDLGVIDANLPQLLGVPKDSERYYWISARARFAANPWLSHGVELHWNNWHQTIGSCGLLDTTPGSGPERDDAAVTLGRTFVDDAAEIFITPWRQTNVVVGNQSVPAYDVHVAFGPFPDNRPPEVSLTASALTVPVGTPVVLEATASDPDGDALAFSWDLGDGFPGGQRPSVTQTWGLPGDYVVRVEVTDFHGGTASRHLVIRVGQVSTLRITGHVIDQSGLPLPGVRVHSGLAGTNSLYAPDYRWTYTDSLGTYSLVGLPPGNYPAGAVLDGYVIRPLNFARPLVLSEFTGVGVDFIATALPKVTVEKVGDGAESGSTPVTFRISRDRATNETLRVFFRTSGTADAGDDYTPWPDIEIQTNTIPTALSPATQLIEYAFVDLAPGIQSTNLLVPVLSDTAGEGDETLILTLAYPVSRTTISETETNVVDIPGWEVRSDNGQDTWFQTRPAYTLGARSEATAKILDSSPSAETVISLVALDTEVSENRGDSAGLMVTWTGKPPVTPLTIPLSISGTADPQEDFEPMPPSVLLTAEIPAFRLTVVPLDDRYVEGNEAVTVRLGTGAGYRLGNASATVVIVDNDLPLVTVSATDPVVAEAGPGARITFQRSGDLEGPIEVDYLLGGTATAGTDYLALSGHLIIPAGSSSASVLITPIDDGLLEGDESVEVRVGDSPVYNTVSPGRALVVLRDDEFPSVTVEADDPDAEEGGEGGTFVIRRTGSTRQPLLVHYRLGGSAAHQADFVASGDRVEIPAGFLQVTIVVTPIEDAIREDDESIVLELLEDPAYGIGSPASAAITLTDNDDNEPAVGFVLLQSSGLESKSRADLAVRVSGNPDEGDDNAVTVAWEVLGGSALNGTDYVLTNGTLVFAYLDPDDEQPLANRVAVIPLEVIDDLLPERNETVLVRLRIAPTEIPAEDPEAPPNLSTNGILDVYSVHTYTILDNDLAEIQVAAIADTTSEGSPDPGLFRIERVGSTNVPQTVVFHLSGLAVPGSDYLDVPRFVTLAPGQSQTNVPVIPVDDPLAEYRENVSLSLVAAPGARLGTSNRAEVVIEDNDGTIEFAVARPTVREGAGTARILVRRTGDTNLTASAVFEASPGTAQPLNLIVEPPTGDFRPATGTLTFQPGVTTQEFTVDIRDDQELEVSETILLRLRRGSDLFPLGGQDSAVLTILDDDALVSTGTNVAAGIESEAELSVILVRTEPLLESLKIRFVTADATAIAGEDYVATEGEVEFAAGVASSTLRIPLLNDFIIEGNEPLLVHLSTLDGVPLGEISATIVDDDCALEFTAGAVEVDEDAGIIELTVRRQGSPLNPVRADFRTVSGTAVAGEDFETTLGTLTFLGNRFETLTNGTGEVVFVPGETNQILTIPVLNDADGERDESFTVVLENARPGSPLLVTPFVSLGSITNTTVTIRDNEAPGHVDDQFQPGLGADATVRTVALQRDGKILVGGDFNTFDGVILPRLARLHADGFVDSSFNPGRGFDGSVLAVAEIADGRLLVGGSFALAAGAARPFLARLEPDGTLSDGAAPQPDGAVHAIAPGAVVFVGGDFNRVSGLSSPGVARLTASGDIDPEFQTGPNGQPGVRALTVLGDGTVMAGGTFTAWGQNGPSYLTRLLPEGLPDPAFPAALAPNGPVRGLVQAPDGSLYVAGDFTTIGGLPRNGVARLLPNGSPDAGFDPGSAADASVLAVGRPDADRLVWAGAFSQFADEPAGRFVRLASDGRRDTAFFRGAGANGTIRTLAVQADGAFLIGGEFTAVNDRPRRRIARIHADDEFAEGFLEFDSAVVTAIESDDTATIAVRRSGTAKAACTVDLVTLPLTATPGEDFISVMHRLEFSPGETRKEAAIELRDDLLPEGSETVSLLLTNFSGAFPGRQAVATLVIADDEAALAFDLAEATVTEDVGSIEWVIRRSGPLTGEVQVGFDVEGISAVPNEDFVAESGTATFPPGVATSSVVLAIIDDENVEGTERLRLRLHSPSGGIALGAQSEAVLTIEDNDRPPTHYTLTVQNGPGGVVIPGGGRFATNSIVELRALPDRDFEFARWEGTITSADNPLLLLMDRNHVISARFRSRDYLETFESGDFSALPWTLDPVAPWSVTSADPASSGQFSARSGVTPSRAASVLTLERQTSSGGGSFDFRTASEAGWDFLEFRLNGVLVERWSGVNGWQTYAFNVPDGLNRLEWRFVRDPTFGGGEDAVWIDNLDLPDDFAPVAAARLVLVAAGADRLVRIESSHDGPHTVESSTDLRTWSVVATGLSSGETFSLSPSALPGDTARFYRVRSN